MGTTSERMSLHRLVDLLPECDLSVARHMLQGLLAHDEDPVLRAFLEAPERDEEMTREDLEALSRGDADLTTGNVVSHEQARHTLLEQE